MAGHENIPAQSQRSHETGLVFNEVLTGKAGQVNVPQFSVLRVSTTAACTVVRETERHSIAFSPTPAVLGNAWQLTFGALGATAGLTDGSNAAAIQAAIRAINVVLNKITVTGVYDTGFIITYVGIVGPVAVPTVTVNALTDAALNLVSINVGEVLASVVSMTMDQDEIELFNAGPCVNGSLGQTVEFNFTGACNVQLGRQI